MPCDDIPQASARHLIGSPLRRAGAMHFDSLLGNVDVLHWPTFFVHSQHSTKIIKLFVVDVGKASNILYVYSKQTFANRRGAVINIYNRTDVCKHTQIDHLSIMKFLSFQQNLGDDIYHFNDVRGF